MEDHFLAGFLEECLKVEDVATSIFRRDGPYIAQLVEGNYFTNAARSRITTNLEREVRDYVYTFMYPEEYTLTESIAASCSIGERDSHSSTSGDEELDDSGDINIYVLLLCIIVKMSASESCIRK